MHPMHMHLVMFQVLDRQPFDVVDGVVVPIGPPIAPPSHEAGWKDTVRVQRSEIVRVIARFESYTGKFPYHCHILEHEDHEMMRQFQTVQCGNNVKEPNEDCDDGNTLDGDCCSSTCTFEVAGSACAPDTDPCTNDVCDGAGNCTHTGGTCTPTHTPTHTPTQTPTDTPTSTPTLTQPPTASPSHTPTRTPTNTPTHTPTVTQAATATPTNTATQTATMTPTQTPTQTTSASPEPTARLLGSVSLEGLPDPPHASWVVPLDVGVFPPSGGAVIETWTPTTDESGNFTCDVSTPGSYLVCVKHAQRLQSCRLATLDPGSTPVAFGNLRAGDADNDNCVELVDFSVLVTTFGLCSGDTGFDQRADFDLSGCVVLIDFSLLATNFSACGDEPASPATTF
jgi:cysteine-rich repeat protein